MITISNEIIKKQENFWNHCLFHPTDAVEDSWGKRILDRMAEDKAVKTIRIYAMLEDIVYIDMKGELCYDFRANDLRLDYLIEKGYHKELQGEQDEISILRDFIIDVLKDEQLLPFLLTL